MLTMDVVLVAKLAGALLVFALGVWVGLGMPGVKHSRESREWRSGARLRATWMNRLFFSAAKAPRRFDAGRLIAPKGEAPEPPGDGEAKKPVVRFRR